MIDSEKQTFILLNQVPSICCSCSEILSTSVLFLPPLLVFTYANFLKCTFEYCQDCHFLLRMHEERLQLTLCILQCCLRVLVYLFSCDKHPDQEQPREERRLQLAVTVHHCRSQGRHSGQKPKGTALPTPQLRSTGGSM